MKFGLTQEFSCSYLPDQREQLLVFVGDDNSAGKDTYSHYELLIEAGFRRSGDQVYRPDCAGCNQCHSIRIDVANFTPSKSQKRILKRNQDLTTKLSRQQKASYYPLYERYINQRHRDGSMFPASQEQYNNFINGSWLQPLFLECYQQQELVAVAVTDEFNQAYSALYSFFHPEMEKRSFGTYLILKQIEHAAKQNKSWLYLGYQIDTCAKMNYKSNFYPHERFFANKWHRIIKKRD